MDKAETMIETSLCLGCSRADNAEDFLSFATTMPLALVVTDNICKSCSLIAVGLACVGVVEVSLSDL